MTEDIKELTLEKLVADVVEIQTAMEDLEAGLKVAKDEIGDRLRAMKVTGTEVNNYYVSRMKRVSFPDVSLEQAKEYGAVVMKKDENKLGKLYKNGVPLKAQITEYVKITPKKEGESV